MKKLYENEHQSYWNKSRQLICTEEDMNSTDEFYSFNWSQFIRPPPFFINETILQSDIEIPESCSIGDAIILIKKKFTERYSDYTKRPMLVIAPDGFVPRLREQFGIGYVSIINRSTQRNKND